MKTPVYVETVDDGWDVTYDGAGICHTKSRTAATRIRDSLNARDPLEGQTVRRSEDVTGVVQATAWTGLKFVCLVRLPDNKLQEWAASGLEVL
jgi:hypothetical protein